MEEKEYLERIHAEILNVMDEVVRICEKHHLKYYMIGGTLLGAVRHQGFIPWDDDMDIAMPREDFDRFVELSEEELQAPFALSWITVHKNYRHLFAKVENRSTAFYEGNMYEPGVYPGIFVDIFPLDTTGGFSNSVKRRKMLVYKLKVMKGLKLHRERVHGIRRLIVDFLSWNTLNKLALRVMTGTNKKGGEWYTNFGSQYNARRQTIRIASYGEGAALPFENRIYNAPEDYTAVLTSIFGDHYMELPPVDKRRTHYPKYVKFSDGEEVAFEEPQIRVDAEENING